MSEPPPRLALPAPLRDLALRLRHLAVLVPLLVLVGTGMRGVDFGEQWDEGMHLGRARTAGDTGSLLPHAYAYPSVCHWLSVAPIAPDALRAWRNDRPAARPTMRALRLLAERAETHPYKLRTRRLFLLVSSLAVLWTYLAAALARRPWAEALLAASLVATSFEFATHARWIAPDTVATSFAALSMALALGSLRRSRVRALLVGSAAAAGVACGTKYNAGLLLLGVLLAAWAAGPRLGSWARRAGFALALVAVFGAAVVVTTPGVVLEHATFLTDVHKEMDHYSSFHSMTGTESIYNAAPGREHARRIADWLARALFSPHERVAQGLAALALVGAAAVLRDLRWRAAVLLAVPAAYLCFFSTRSVMIVRNLLLVTPFLALLAARGGAALYRLLPWRAWRAAVALALAAAMAFNARHLRDAAEGVARRRQVTWADDLTAALRADPAGRYRVSTAVAAGLQRQGLALPGNATLGRAPGQRGLVVLLSEYPEDVRNEKWGPTRPHALTWYGPREVNLNDYPTWRATVDRAVLLTDAQATSFGVCVECFDAPR